MNLLSNAFKFTKLGGSVTLDYPYGIAAACIVRVTDPGIGIAPDEVPPAFAKFDQIDTRLLRKYDGVELGLTIKKLLGYQHGG